MFLLGGSGGQNDNDSDKAKLPMEREKSTYIVMMHVTEDDYIHVYIRVNLL